MVRGIVIEAIAVRVYKPLCPLASSEPPSRTGKVGIPSVGDSILVGIGSQVVEPVAVGIHKSPGWTALDLLWGLRRGGGTVFRLLRDS